MSDTTDSASTRRVLNAGSGRRGSAGLPPPFHDGWAEVTLDIDPAFGPDIVGSICDMRGAVPDGSFDAVWSSHALEHVYGFEVPTALGEFRRVLRPEGFAFVTCPDVEAVAAALLEHGLDWVAYESEAGPITLHDILYGHTRSIRDGMPAMAHRTGLTAQRLGELALEAGFADVAVGRGPHYDLWGVLAMPETDHGALAAALAGSPAAFLYEAEAGERP